MRAAMVGAVLVVLLSACSQPANDPPPVDPEPSVSVSAAPQAPADAFAPVLREFEVPQGSRPHDVAPAADGGVWYTAQGSGELGHLDPATGEVTEIDIGGESAPHGVIVAPDGAAWVTDGGLNAILRVDPGARRLERFPVLGPDANLNTATFDGKGILWFTGQAGIYGQVDPATGFVNTYTAPKGSGPYGMTTAPDGTVWFSSLAGSYIARIDPETGRLKVFDVPTSGGGARRVWSDSAGRMWVTEWFAGKLAMFDPAIEQWREWQMPGESPKPYAVFVDDKDIVWISDFGTNSMVRFDSKTEEFDPIPLESKGANVRQILGRPGEVWGAESGASKLVLIKTA